MHFFPNLMSCNHGTSHQTVVYINLRAMQEGYTYRDLSRDVARVSSYSKGDDGGDDEGDYTLDEISDHQYARPVDNSVVGNTNSIEMTTYDRVSNASAINAEEICHGAVSFGEDPLPPIDPLQLSSPPSRAIV